MFGRRPAILAALFISLLIFMFLPSQAHTDLQQVPLQRFLSNTSSPSDGPLDPYADKVFLMLKSGATVIRSRLPAHIRSTLSRWPHHAVYADIETNICGIDVIDIFKWMPEELLERHKSYLRDYFVLRRSQDEQWMWDLDGLRKYDGWKLDRFKNIPMLAHAWLTAPEDTEWFFFMDADTYVFQRGLLKFLKKYDHNEPVYVGRAADWETEAYNLNGEYVKIPFAHGGSGVALSRGAMARLFGEDPHSDRSQLDAVVEKSMVRGAGHCCGDALVGIMLYEYLGEFLVDMPWGRYPSYDNPFQGSTLRDVAVGPNGWCLPYYSWHHLIPREVDELYDYERNLPINHGDVSFSQIYRDIILPFVVPERENWDAVAGHKSGIWEDRTSMVYDVNSERPENLDPAGTKEDCRATCELHSDCLLWVFEDSRCQLELGVVFRGIAVNSNQKGGYRKKTSGWMVDRIREKRLQAQCDPLSKSEDGEWNDTEDTSEGWFVRKTESETS